MNNYIGIDLGTSAVKLLLVAADGTILRSVTKSYPISFPRPGWSEQNPEDWWEAVKAALAELCEGVDSIKGIGIGGQMHGLVIVDKDGNCIRPAILWNDGRTDKETEYLNSVVGREKLSKLTANIAFAGFTAPKLLWLRENEPESFNRIDKIMLPKDYISYRLTGEHCTDFSDASGMLLLDVEHRRWSDEMLEICSLRKEQLPRLLESSEVVGTVKAELGLGEGVIVVAGAGDNAAAAVGTGTVKDGDCNISLGTSGTVFIASDSFGVDRFNALHSFAHATGKYHLMGCMLSAASCNKWFCEEILKTNDFAAEQTGIDDERLGRNNVYFLPYLMGERSPINDTDARGAFIGMSMDSTRRDMVQAVLEGVAFALRDSLEVARSLGLSIERSKLCGGGARSGVWRRMIANILNISVEIPQTEEGPSYGGAMLAMVGAGEYASVEDCADKLVKVTEVIEPDAAIAARYEERYRRFKLLYPALKDSFKALR